MPKIRALKPDFWTDKHIVTLTAHARLLYMGLWNFAADCGHVEDEPVELKMRILPADNVDIDDLLTELDKAGRIIRAGGWITIPKFASHQKLDRRYFTYCDPCKAHREHGGEQPPQGAPPVVVTPGPHREHTVSTVGPRDGGDGDGDGDGDGESAAGKPATPRKKPAKRIPFDWEPTEEHRVRCSEERIDMAAQVAKFKAHAEANDRTQVNWNAAFTQWLLNVPEWQRTAKPTRNLPHASQLEAPPDGLSELEYAEWERAQRERRRA